MEKLSLNAVQVDQSIQWENIVAELPGQLSGHRCVVYNERLIIIGGFNCDKVAFSNSITEISLVPPWLPCQKEDVIVVLQSLVIRSWLLEAGASQFSEVSSCMTSLRINSRS